MIDSELTLKGKGATARGRETAGGFLVRSGSTATKELSAVFARTRNLVKIRENLLNSGVLVDRGQTLYFANDFIFKSPSAAASIIVGNPANGLSMWKDAEGLSLHVLRAQLQPK
jgi:hypothetical protein